MPFLSLILQNRCAYTVCRRMMGLESNCAQVIDEGVEQDQFSVSLSKSKNWSLLVQNWYITVATNSNIFLLKTVLKKKRKVKEKSTWKNDFSSNFFLCTSIKMWQWRKVVCGRAIYLAALQTFCILLYLFTCPRSSFLDQIRTDSKLSSPHTLLFA